jgi:hypothetical protein
MSHVPVSQRSSYNRELNVRRSKFTAVVVDVLNPLVVFIQPVCRDSNHFDVSFLEILCTAGNLAEFRGADGCKITRVRE